MKIKTRIIIGLFAVTAGWVEAAVITINPASTGAVDANAAIWGSPVAAPVGGDEYVYDLTGGGDFLKIFEGNNAFPGDKLSLASGTLTKVKAWGDFGNLVMNGGTLSINASGSPTLTGSFHVDADLILSNQLPEGNTATINMALSGAGNLNISTFLNSVNTVFDGSDAGFSGDFILGNSGSDGASHAVSFNQSYTGAGLTFQGGNTARAPVYQLVNNISFLTVSMPSSADSSVLINLSPGTYDAASLATAGINSAYFNDLGGTISVDVSTPSYAAWAASWGIDIGTSSSDHDGDLISNLGEYGMGGDPTNVLDVGLVPTFENHGGTMAYVHAQRTGDSNLTYYLETSDDLAFGIWTNAGYFVAGTNMTGGTFDYVTNMVPTAAPGFFIRLIVAADGCLAPIIPIPYSDFSVVDFGATGNGVSNDTSAIQAAIDAAGTQGGGVVWFPSGTYIISSPLVLTNRVSLLGRGAGGDAACSIIKASIDMPSMLQTPPGAGGNVTIENLMFDGLADEGVMVGCALDLNDFIEGRVAHVAITNVSGEGIHSRASGVVPSWVNWFLNLDIAVGGYALRLGSSDSYVNGVHVDGGLGIREELHAGNLYRNCIVENCVDGISVTNPSGDNLRMSITECSFYNNTNHGLSFGFGTAFFDSYISVDGCAFDGNGEADVYLGNCSRIALRRNDFMTAAPSHGENIKMQGYVNYVTLTDNHFSTATQSLLGSESQSISNQFSVVTWDGITGAFPRDDLVLLPSGGEIWNVKDFGAVGNGVVDDTGALQTALDAAQSGDTVYLPSGAYRITSTLQLSRSGISILGDGYGNTGSKIVAGNSLASMVETPVAISDICMAKLNFVGKSSLGYVVGHALFLSHLTDSEFDRVRVSDLSGNGIVFGSASARNHILNCNMGSEGWGISLEGGNCKIDGLYCSGGYGVRVFGDGGHQILNSHFERATSAGIQFAGPLVGTANTLIRNCYFDLNAKAISFGFDVAQAANVAVESCLFRVNAVDLDMTNTTHVSLESSTHLVRPAGTVHLQTIGTVDDLSIIGNVFENAVSIPGVNSVFYGNTMP